MLEERGAQSDAEPVLRRTEAVTAVPDTTVPETAVPETAARERAPAASLGKPLPAPRFERAMRLATDRRDAAARELLQFIADRLDQIEEVPAGTFEPSPEVLDPEIAPAVHALNAAGIKTVFSCQGIDGISRGSRSGHRTGE
jgi:hypothetical protein